MRQAGHRQLGHVGNIAIIETTTATHCEHGGDPLQIRSAYRRNSKKEPSKIMAPTPPNNAVSKVVNVLSTV
jgi:hypothetical protein